MALMHCNLSVLCNEAVHIRGLWWGNLHKNMFGTPVTDTCLTSQLCSDKLERGDQDMIGLLWLVFRTFHLGEPSLKKNKKKIGIMEGWGNKNV